MMKQIICGLLAGWITLQLPSCAFTASVETMLTPPRLTVEQEQIYQALQTAVGTSVSLKYPKTGERLSAFTVEDLNADGADEAIVFYEAGRSTAEENSLRVCLLAQENGAWRAMAEYPAAGAEIERIDIERLGSNPRMNLIIRYSIVDGASRTVEVLHCENSALTRSLSLPYSSMAVRDLNGDGEQELFVISGTTSAEQAAATVYELNETGSYIQSQASLPESFTEITNIGYGMLPDSSGISGLPAVYIDGASGATTAQTAVLTYQDTTLSVVYADAPERFPNTARPAGCLTADVDGDGELEIPVQIAFYGYANATDGSPLSMTNWYVCRGGLLMRECSSYYSPSDGYVFALPARWERRVTAVQEDDEIVFYEYDTDSQQEDGSPVLIAPLLRLAVEADPIAAEAMQERGYLLLQSRSGISYLASLGSGSDAALTLTQSELLFAMKYL